MEFETIDISVTYGDKAHLWVSAVSRLGTVHGVPRHSLPYNVPKEFNDEADIRDILFPSQLRDQANSYRGLVRTGRRSPNAALTISHILGQHLFGIGELRDLFQRTRGAASHRRVPLVVRFQAAPKIVAALPWELLPDPAGGTHKFLTLASDVHFVRLARARTYLAETAPIAPPLRLLLILSNPPLPSSSSPSVKPFDVYEEKRALMAELQPLIDDGYLIVDVEDRPTIENLRSRTVGQANGYHILHYVGYATTEGLVLEDHAGRAISVPPDSFSSAIKGNRNLRLAVFTGCETAQSPDQDADERWPEMLSLADILTRDLCPMVVGMQAVIPFRSERIFARTLYRGLVGGRSVADSIDIARSAVAEDKFVGQGVLDWSVPCLFVGSEPVRNLIDRSIMPVPPIPKRREELKIDFEEGEREFFGRHIQLRKAIDFLTARTNKRVLWIFERSGTGKMRLIDRALDDVGEQVDFVLSVPVKHLSTAVDPILALCEIVAELLTRSDGEQRICPNQWSGMKWWQRLLEEIVRKRFVIVFDNRFSDSIQCLEKLKDVIASLAKRRSLAKLIIVDRETERPTNWPELENRVEYFRLEGYSWEEILLWIRRNLPALNIYTDDMLQKFRQDMADSWPAWQELAEEVVAQDQNAKLSNLVNQVKARRIPPHITIQSRGVTSYDSQQSSSSEQPSSLKVAVAGPNVSERENEFARGLTALAGTHSVGGRVVSSDRVNENASLGMLLPLPSPFGNKGTASDSEIIRWINEALKLETDIILLDFGSLNESLTYKILVSRLKEQEIFVIGSSGTSLEPFFPGWLPDVFTVGPLNSDGNPGQLSFWDKAAKKPNLFAPDSVKDTELEDIVKNPDFTGPSIAALHVVAAAVLVWSTDRSMKLEDLRTILVSTGDLVDELIKNPNDGSLDCLPRKLNLTNALEQVRRNMIKEALIQRPLDMETLVAACPLQTAVTVRLVDKMNEEGILEKSIKDGTARYSLI